MKIRMVIVTGAVLISAVGLASGTYRNLKQNLEDYAPPAMLHQPEASETTVKAEPDAFEAAKKTIEDARDRWTKMVDGNALPAGDTVISPAIIGAAADETQILAALRPRFSLQTAQSLILLRNPSIQAATNRFKAALEGFDQVTQLDEILRQYSAFTAGVMPGVGPMKGIDTVRMKFPFPGVTALKGQVAEKNVEAEKQVLDPGKPVTRMSSRSASAVKNLMNSWQR
ncbi:MAG: hypothetical protein HGJ93_18480 [Desulfosarcina sp.]|nr:hypothetical protein [Desulfosarcina sp.]MBC2767855.1 hypothetical protein [Desulfosarcina sp.]